MNRSFINHIFDKALPLLLDYVMEYTKSQYHIILIGLNSINDFLNTTLLKSSTECWIFLCQRLAYFYVFIQIINAVYNGAPFCKLQAKKPLGATKIQNSYLTAEQASQGNIDIRNFLQSIKTWARNLA